jgi:hypothetical protein
MPYSFFQSGGGPLATNDLHRPPALPGPLFCSTQIAVCLWFGAEAAPEDSEPFEVKMKRLPADSGGQTAETRRLDRTIKATEYSSMTCIFLS